MLIEQAAGHDLLVNNIGLLATPLGTAPRAGQAMGEIALLSGAAVAVRGQKVSWVGPAREAPLARSVIDAGGALVTPGLVDCHTHLLFGGWRQQEVTQRLGGMSYLEIQQADGMQHTITATAALDFDALYERAQHFAREMLALGVTLCEAKVSYAWELEEQLKQLRVVRQMNLNGPMALVPTLMPPGMVPPGFENDRAGYIDALCNQHIPAVAEHRLARFFDVHCDVAMFSAAEAAQLLAAAKAAGLGLKLHADMLEPVGASGLAAECGAISADHLIATPVHAMAALAEAGVVGVLLPATSLYLGKPYARAYEMLKAGMALAVGSNFNPGNAPCNNLQLAINMAFLKYQLTPGQVLCAVTLNAAAALGLADYYGSVEVGKTADLVVWDAPDLETLLYRFGTNLVKKVIIGGKEQALCRQ